MRIWGTALFCDDVGNQLPPVNLVEMKCSKCGGSYRGYGVKVDPAGPVQLGVVPLKCKCGHRASLTVAAVYLQEEEDD